MKEFVEKLIARLEEGIFSFEERLQYDTKTQRHLVSQNKGIKYAIAIVNQLAEEMSVAKNAITNADRMRSMSNEELAEFLVNFENTFGEEYEGVMSCLEWLQSEAE